MSKALKRVEVLLSHWGGNKTVVVSVADLREVVATARSRDVAVEFATKDHHRTCRCVWCGVRRKRAPVSTAKRGRKR